MFYTESTHLLTFPISYMSKCQIFKSYEHLHKYLFKCKSINLSVTYHHKDKVGGGFSTLSQMRNVTITTFEVVIEF